MTNEHCIYIIKILGPVALAEAVLFFLFFC